MPDKIYKFEFAKKHDGTPNYNALTDVENHITVTLGDKTLKITRPGDKSPIDIGYFAAAGEGYIDRLPKLDAASQAQLADIIKEGLSILRPSTKWRLSPSSPSPTTKIEHSR